MINIPNSLIKGRNWFLNDNKLNWNTSQEPVHIHVVCAVGQCHVKEMKLTRMNSDEEESRRDQREDRPMMDKEWLSVQTLKQIKLQRVQEESEFQSPTESKRIQEVRWEKGEQNAGMLVKHDHSGTVSEEEEQKVQWDWTDLLQLADTGDLWSPAHCGGKGKEIRKERKP